MLFTDPVFLFLLLPLACFLFYAVTPRFGYSAGFGLLLIVSLLFYFAWGAIYFYLLIASFTVNFAAACCMVLTPDDRRFERRAALIIGQLYNFGTLFWFKYRFFVFSFSAAHVNYSVVDLAIPIGISFYTFQQAIFLVDAYNRNPHAVAYLGDMRTLWGKLRGYIHHAFFVSFFPHLIIGPIIYLSEFQPQVENPSFGKVKWLNLEVGLTLIVIGMFKKTILADNLAPIANNLFSNADLHVQIPLLAAWIGSAAYYAQLYFDFSGYADMAIGTARMLGIRFPMNFYSPLKAVGVVDFYRRWHITLTRVISRFIYTPLSVNGTRVAIRRRLPKIPAKLLAQWLPLMINFEMIALWHGARMTFLLFGLVQGLWYVIETEIRASKTFKAWRKTSSDHGRALIGRIIFTFLMVICFALFRSSSVVSFEYLLSQMFTGPLSLAQMDILGQIQWVVPALAVLWLLPNSMEFLRRYRPGIPTYQNQSYVPRWLLFAWRPSFRWAVIIFAMFLATLYTISRQPPFLYMGF